MLCTNMCINWYDRFHCACVDLDPDEADDIDTWMCNGCIEKYGDEKAGMWFISFMLCMSGMQLGYFGIQNDMILVRRRGLVWVTFVFVISQCYSPFYPFRKPEYRICISTLLPLNVFFLRTKERKHVGVLLSFFDL